MVEWTLIPITDQTILLTIADTLSNWWKEIVLAIIAAMIVEKFSLLKYFKKLYGWVLIKGQQLIVFIQLVPRLWMISSENTHEYEKMIDFVPCYKCSYPVIKASDSALSPSIEFNFSITNCSIFDFKIEKISMNVHDNNDYRDDIRTVAKDIDLPHQQVIKRSCKLELNPKFIENLKSFKEKYVIILEDVKIYLKDKTSPISCGRFNFRMHNQDTICEQNHAANN